LPKRALLALDEQGALTLENQEVFLSCLVVVQRHRLSGLQVVQAHPEIVEVSLALAAEPAD
jgi:hypothetical protein